MESHPLFAAVYDRMMGPAERAGLSARRRRLLAGASGRVLEVGGGTGANLAHYPAAVTQLVVLEPDAAMRERLLAKVPAAPVSVEVHEIGIEDAPFRDGSFDTIVSTATLCTVTDLDAAFTAVRRLLAADGKLLFLEHVRAPGLQGLAQRASAPLWTRVAAGCHPDRDTLAAMRASGFVVTELDRFRIRLAANPLINWAVQGAARPQKVTT
jgi:SAM-dependent methyltransferase